MIDPALLPHFHQRKGAPTVSVLVIWAFDGSLTDAHCHSTQGPQLIMLLPRLTLSTASRIPQRKSLLVAVCGMLGSFRMFVFERTAPGLSKVPSRWVNSCAESCPRVL